MVFKFFFFCTQILKIELNEDETNVQVDLNEKQLNLVIFVFFKKIRFFFLVKSLLNNSRFSFCSV